MNKQSWEIVRDQMNFLYQQGYNTGKELDKSLDEQAGVNDHDCHLSPEDGCEYHDSEPTYYEED
jgi:hypothetical protein